MLAGIPALTGTQTSATADLQITRALDTDTSGDGPNCLSQGHFKECPTYAVTIPDTTFASTSPLTTTYRIDASSLKMVPNKILNSVLISYSSDGGATFTTVQACTNGAPTGTGVPCILSSQCFKNNVQPADLAGDCEWILINTKNGLTKFF